MSRTGPAPKDPSVRARRNKDSVQVRVVEARIASRPQLPAFEVEKSWRDKESGELISEMVPFTWPEQTRAWWDALDLHPLAPEFIDADWSYLLETARVHAEFWLGDMRQAGELRQRESKYGFTPEDRIKLRISLATAAEVEQRVTRRQPAPVRRKGADPRLKLVE